VKTQKCLSDCTEGMEDHEAGAREPRSAAAVVKKDIPAFDVLKSFAKFKIYDIDTSESVDVAGAAMGVSRGSERDKDSDHSGASLPPGDVSSDSDEEDVCGNTDCPGLGNTKSGGHCSKCHDVWYCSRDCQKKSWPDHKRDCCSVAVVGRTVASNYFPDPQLSMAARVLVPANMQEHVRNKNARRKRLLSFVDSMKLRISDRRVEMQLVRADKRPILCRDICLAMHVAAACFLYLGQGVDARRYMRRAEMQHAMISQTMGGDNVPLFDEGWQNLPFFLQFVELENEIAPLKRRVSGAFDAKIRFEKSSELIALMDKKVLVAESLMCMLDLFELNFQTWEFKVHLDIVCHSMRDKPEYIRKAIDLTSNCRLLASVAQKCRQMKMTMEYVEKLRSLVFTPDKEVVSRVRRWCENPSCTIPHSSEINSGCIKCAGCDSCFYCSGACQKSHKLEHNFVCAKMRSVGLGVQMFLNDEVMKAKFSESALIHLHAQLRDQLVRKVIELSAVSRNFGRTPKVHVLNLEAINIIIEATQVNLLLGFSVQAHAQLMECEKLFGIKMDFEDSQLQDDDAIGPLVERYSQFLAIVADLRVNVIYYLRETMMVRLLHARQKQEEQWKQVLIYAHVFEELDITIKFTRQFKMPVREFFARFLLWREGKRFSVHGDTRTDSFHDTYIDEALSSLPTAHEACETLYNDFLRQIEVKRGKQVEVVAEVELAKAMLINLEMMKGIRKRLKGEVVRLIY